MAVICGFITMGQSQHYCRIWDWTPADTQRTDFQLLNSAATESKHDSCHMTLQVMYSLHYGGAEKLATTATGVVRNRHSHG
jgi:hypothetical protein